MVFKKSHSKKVREVLNQNIDSRYKFKFHSYGADDLIPGIFYKDFAPTEQRA